MSAVSLSSSHVGFDDEPSPEGLSVERGPCSSTILGADVEFSVLASALSPSRSLCFEVGMEAVGFWDTVLACFLSLTAASFPLFFFSSSSCSSSSSSSSLSSFSSLSLSSSCLLLASVLSSETRTLLSDGELSAVGVDVC